MLNRLLKETRRALTKRRRDFALAENPVNHPHKPTGRGRIETENRMMYMHIILQGKKYIGKFIFLCHSIMIRLAMTINQLDLIKINQIFVNQESMMKILYSQLIVINLMP